MSESGIAREQVGNFYKVFRGCDEDDRERQTVCTVFAGRHWFTKINKINCSNLS